MDLATQEPVLPPSLALWRACPHCASPQLTTVVGEPGAQPHLVCAACHAAWYANPKPTVSAVVERESDGHVLLIRRAIEPFLGRWDTPGGFVEDGEEPVAALHRELREECGIERLRVGAFLGAWNDAYGEPAESTISTCNLFWAASVSADEVVVAASDALEVGWFAPTDVPSADELAFACVPRAVDAWLARR